MHYCFNSSLQEGTGRPGASSKTTACAELVLDVSPKTQRVILKKKVREPSTYNLEEEVFFFFLSPAGVSVRPLFVHRVGVEAAWMASSGWNTEVQKGL